MKKTVNIEHAYPLDRPFDFERFSDLSSPKGCTICFPRGGSLFAHFSVAIMNGPALLFYFLILALPFSSNAQPFKIVNEGKFEPLDKRVFLCQDSLTGKQLIFFKSKLQVNTDGTPISYHPDDLHGKRIAINTIGNAISVRKKGSSKNLCLDKKTYSEAIRVFADYRDSDFKTVPAGYEITWKNVLAAEQVGGIDRPCIIKDGPYSGYFGSLTALKNGLQTNRGPCECDNQVNPLEIPGLVLPGGNNIVKEFGAKVGDLVVAYNPKNDSLVYGIINDSGPANKLGEGSVRMNMDLLGSTEVPKTRSAVYRLVPRNDIVVVILPASSGYQLIRPYSAENVRNRIESWFAAVGIETKGDLKNTLKSIANHEPNP